MGRKSMKNMKSILKKKWKRKIYKIEKKKELFGSTLYPFKMFHFFLVRNRIKSYFMIPLPIFYPSCSSFLCCFVYPLFFFFLRSIDVGKHCGEHLKNEKENAFWRWNKFVFMFFFCVFLPHCGDFLLLDERRNKRTHWMFSWSIDYNKRNDFSKKIKTGSMYQRPIALNEEMSKSWKSFFLVFCFFVFLRFIIPEGT